MQATSTRPRRALGFAQVGLGALALVGSSFEVLNLLVPSLIPEIQNQPMMRMHHENPVVYAWTLLSNVVNAPLAAVLLVGGLGVLRAQPWARRVSRFAAIGMAGIVAGAALISSIYLVPANLALARSPVEQDAATGLVMLISIGSAILGMGSVLTLILLGHRRKT